MVLTQKQTHRSMEQNKQPRNEPSTLWSTNLRQSRKECPMEKKQSLLQLVLGKLDSHMQKNETGRFPYTTHKNKLKMKKNLNVRQESIKIFEENTDRNLFNFSCSNFFLETLPKAREARVKMNYWDFIKTKSFAQQRK